MQSYLQNEKYFKELENFYFELSKKEKLIKDISEENYMVKKLNENIKGEVLMLKDLMNKKEDVISNLKAKIGQLESDKIVIFVIKINLGVNSSKTI